MGEVVEGQAVRLVLAPGQRVAGSRACADAEVEPPAGDDVDGRGDLGQHRGRSEAVAGHEQPEAQALGLCGEGREQRPAFEDRPVGIAADRHEVIEQPRVLDLRDRVRLAPDPQDVVVVDLHRGGHDPETRPRCVQHGVVRPSFDSTSTARPSTGVEPIRGRAVRFLALHLDSIRPSGLVLTISSALAAGQLGSAG